MLNEIPAVLSPKAEQQMEVIKSIFLEGDDRSYGAKIADAAAKLGKCERTIRRLIKKWRDDGLVGLTQIGRSDKGSSRLDEDWQKFILKTYKEGNQGSKRMTRKQVAVMVKAKAEELQVKPPSHMSVYRILNLTFPVKFGWPTASPQLDHVIEPILSKEPQYQWEFYDDAPDSRLTSPQLQ
jgi:putative transposase